MSEHPKQLVLVPNAADFVKNEDATQLTPEQIAKLRKSSEAVLDVVFGVDADTAGKEQLAMTTIADAAVKSYVKMADLSDHPFGDLIAGMRLGTLLLNRAIGSGVKTKAEALLMQANMSYLMAALALDEASPEVRAVFDASVEAATPDFERTRLRIKVLGEGKCPCDKHLAQAGHDAVVRSLSDLPADIRMGLEFIAKAQGRDVQEVFDDLNARLMSGQDPSVAAESQVEAVMANLAKDGTVGIIEGDTAPKSQDELDQIIAEIVQQLPPEKRALATQKLREKLTLEAIKSGEPVVLEIDLS